MTKEAKQEYDRLRYLQKRGEIKARVSAYYQANLDERRRYARGYYTENFDIISVARKGYSVEHRKLHGDARRAWEREYTARRYASDIAYRLECVCRARLRAALVGKSRKGEKTLSLLGCSSKELKKHLENILTPGMTWENYGSVWEIDHVKPCAKFDLSDIEQQKVCFHWTNLQPLFKLENRKKGCR